MARLSVLLALFLLPVHTVLADTRSDLLALTGNCRVKAAWLCWPWCDATYTPVQSRLSSLANSQVLVYDTYDGQVRHLDTTVADHGYNALLTAKDASQVIWCDSKAHVAWIRDFAGTSPPRKLIDGGDFSVVHCQYNRATGVEYIYVISQDGMAAYRMPLTPSYTADLTLKSRLPYLVGTQLPAGNTIDGTFTVSSDGLYIGCGLGCPRTQIFNSSTGQCLARVCCGDIAGCNTNIAPDSSYRFFYLNDAHTLFRMWDAGLSATQWDVNIVNGLPGTILPQMDVGQPHWTNNTQFFTVAPPVQAGAAAGFQVPTNFDLTAAQVQALDPAVVHRFILGKFSADFRTVEKYVMIAGGDIRSDNDRGRAWVALSPSAVGPGGISRPGAAWLPAVTVRGNRVLVTLPSGGGAGVISLVNTSGREVARTSCRAAGRCEFAGEPAGTYVVGVTAGPAVYRTRVSIAQ